MNNKKQSLKKPDEKTVEQVADQDRHNQNTNETSEFTSNTSASTSSSLTTSPSAENKNQNNVDENSRQTVANNEQSPALSQNQVIAQTPIPYINYYPFIQGSNTFAAPLDFNSANWSQTMAMAKNGLSDQISVAAYINAAGFNPAEIASFDQFNFAYPQAYGFGFGNPQISPIADFQPNHRNYNKRHSTNSNSNNVQFQNFYANTSNNQKNKSNKLETDFNSLSLNDYKNTAGRNIRNSKNTQNGYNRGAKRYNYNYVNNQANFVDNENAKSNESENKTWSNAFPGSSGEIVNQMEPNRFFNNQFNYNLNQSNINNFSSYAMPELSSDSKHLNNIENQYDAKNFFKSMNSNQSKQEFSIDNNSFPPINSNYESKVLQENPSKTNIQFENQNQSNYTFNKNYYKRQQYNNYQKQQQKQFGNLTNFYSNIEPDFNTYHLSNYREKPISNPKKQYSDEEYYYKHQQPPQLKISSFMTNLDKKFFMDDEKKNDMNPVQIDLKPNKIDTSSYNPIEFNITPIAARFFVIKSYSEDDVFASIKHNVWCSTEHGNRRLNSAYIKGEGNTPVYLFFSVNGSRHFCGMAEMMSRVDFNRRTELWSQDKWRGCFQVKWIYVKDVPNSLLRNIKLENNDNKPVTNSRDTQEIPFDKGIQVLKVFHTFKHTSSIFDDFDHYENTKHEEEASAKVPLKIDSKSESQLIIPVKNDTSSSSMCSPDSSSSYGSNSNTNTDVNFNPMNQPEFIHANIGHM